MYKDSAWIFIGGLNYDLSEGDIICVFSQYGEVADIHLVRDKDTGNSKGFCFLCYTDQRSTILAVDNLNGIKLCNRIIRVDHCQNYQRPEEKSEKPSSSSSSRMTSNAHNCDRMEDKKHSHRHRHSHSHKRHK